VKLGAFDYIEKPFDQEQIRQVVDKALRTHSLRAPDARLRGAGRRGALPAWWASRPPSGRCTR
jgi:FixJ family two-component response regulator